MATAQQHGRRTLLLIAASFFVPIAVAAWMYYSGSSWRPAETTQLGDLITPPRLIPDTALAADDDTQRLHGSWNLLVLSGASCSSACNEAIDHVQRVRLSLGPKMSRVQTVYLPAAATAIPVNMQSDYPAMHILAPELSGDIRSVVGDFTEGQVFLVDPLGNLMMQYEPDTEMAAIRKDLARLLNLSGIG
jgi:hypothetical protein